MAETAQSTIRLIIETYADTTAVQQAAAAVSQMGEAANAAADSGEAAAESTDAVSQVAEAVKVAAEKAGEASDQHAEKSAKATKATLEGAEANKKLATETGNSGYKMQVLGQFLNDLPYGVGAVSGQISQLAMAFGVGGGLAGVLTIVATGIDFTIKQLKNFGGGSDETAEKAKKLNEELTKTAEKSEAAADKAEDAAAAARHVAEASKEEADRLQDIEGWYARVARSINDTAKARQAEISAIERQKEAEAELALARVDLAEASGELDKKEAIQRRAEITAGSASDRQRLREQARVEREKEMEALAINKQAEADAMAVEQRVMSGRSQGLMSDKDRAAAEARKQAEMDWQAKQQKAVEEAQVKFQEADDRLRETSARFSQGKGSSDPFERQKAETVIEASRAARQAAMDELVNAQQARAASNTREQIATRDLSADQDARARTPFANKEEAAKWEEEQAAKIQRNKDEAERMRKEIEASRVAGEADKRVFETKQQAEAIRREIQLKQEQKREEEQAAKEEERRRREAEKPARKGAVSGVTSAPQVPGGGTLDSFDRGAEADMIEQLRGFVQAGAANAEAVAALAGEIKSATVEMKKKTAAAAAATASLRDGK